MTKRLKMAVLVIAALMFSIQAMAQSFSVKAKISDEAGQPVGYATVSLVQKNSTKAYKYELSDDEGNVSFSSVKSGEYTFKVELMGYKTLEKEIEVKAALDLGELVLAEDQEVLEAAKVTDVGNPITIKKDTVEYNASSFMVTDNDMLENLLKKLPGIEVDENGSIKANGESVTRIYVDGKSFFLDDPQLASKNLPAKMIEKVKVVKKKSEQAEFTGIDDGREETVIDLSVAPSMMNGMFGNVMAGGGRDLKGESTTASQDLPILKDGFRYQSNAMIGNFKKDSQLSLILNANNANNSGFGGGGGGGGNGITSSWMAGLNGAWNLFDNKMELTGDYVYNGSNSKTGSVTDKTTFMTDGSNLINHTKNEGSSYSDGHRFGMRLEHEFSKNASILFEPQFNFGRSGSGSSSEFNTENSISGKTNEGWSSNTSDGNNWSTSGRFLYRQRLGLPGRTLSLNVDWSHSNNESESFTQSLTKSYKGGSEMLSPINQRNLNNSDNSSVSARLEYTEPMGNNFYLSANYQYSWSESNSNKDTWNSGEYDISAFNLDNLIYNRKGESYDDTYSNRIYNRNINQQAGFNVMYQDEKVNAQVGASLMPRKIFNETNGKSYEDNNMNWAPNASVRIRFNNYSNVRLNYSGRSSQPSTTQLMPVMNNSNPLNMTLGNPYLQSYFSHSYRTEYGYTNRQSFLSARVTFNGSVTQNPIVNAIWYDEKGAQYSFPINGKNSSSENGTLMLNAPIGKTNLRFSSNTSVNYSQSHSYVGAKNLNMDGYFNEKREFNYEKFHEDYFGKNSVASFDEDFIDNLTRNLGVSENLQLTYRSDYFETTIGINSRVSKPWYTIETTGNVNTTWTHRLSYSLNWNSKNNGFGASANANYNWYRGYTTPQPSNFIINAEITKIVFGGRATLAIRGYDLLNQTKTLSVSDTSNYHSETRSLALGRYVIASLTFRFGTFGGRHGAGRGGNRGGGMPPMGGGMPMRR